ncbi:GNAT family N-acetyltransferase [Streptomyces sp. SID5474]|nr:GNAT family N-acetyltransferase [Streptomyces sp. SID5474]
MTAAATGGHVTAMRPEHADQVLAIHRLGIDEGNATFETTAPDWQGFDATRLREHRLVALDRDDRVLGWAAVVPVSDRCAYAGVVEHSVYVHPRARGLGVGLALLRALLASTEAAGIWTVQSGIFPENTASLALHRRASPSPGRPAPDRRFPPRRRSAPARASRVVASAPPATARRPMPAPAPAAWPRAVHSDCETAGPPPRGRLLRRGP